MIKRVGALVVLACFAVAPLTGCAKFKKQKECQEIIKTINEGVTKAKAVNTKTPAGLKQFAETYEKIGGDVGKLEVTDPELKKATTDYQALCKDVAKAARDASEPAKAAAASKEIDAAIKKENELTQRINTTCSRLPGDGRGDPPVGCRPRGPHEAR